ncbi:hypothetical protein, partial [Chromobacterium aquaticum]
PRGTSNTSLPMYLRNISAHLQKNRKQLLRACSKSREQERDKALRLRKRNVQAVHEHFEVVFNAVSPKRSRL